MKKIAILGGSGFVGGYIVDQLIKSGFAVKMINRSQSLNTYDKQLSEAVINLSSDLLYKDLIGCDSIIYNVGIIREFPSKGISFKNIHEDLAIHSIKMAEKAGVRKFILMTANGVERCLTRYEKTKFKAEQYLMKSEMEWTIFRPSIIFGDPKGKIEFCTQIKNDIVVVPLPIPIFFNGVNILNAGTFKMSPIHVINVAQFFVEAINKESSNQKIYNLGGSESYNWIEMTKIISEACGKKKWGIPVPILGIKLVAFFLDRFAWFPITRDQLLMLSLGNVYDGTKYFVEYGIDEISFNIQNLDYLS